MPGPLSAISTVTFPPSRASHVDDAGRRVAQSVVQQIVKKAAQLVLICVDGCIDVDAQSKSMSRRSARGMRSAIRFRRTSASSMLGRIRGPRRLLSRESQELLDQPLRARQPRFELRELLVGSASIEMPSRFSSCSSMAVIGVRSSCAASCTKRRCEVKALRSRVEQCVDGDHQWLISLGTSCVGSSPASVFVLRAAAPARSVRAVACRAHARTTEMIGGNWNHQRDRQAGLHACVLHDVYRESRVLMRLHGAIAGDVHRVDPPACESPMASRRRKPLAVWQRPG